MGAPSIVPSRSRDPALKTSPVMATIDSLTDRPVDVLVVDDHPFFREGIIAWLSRQKDLRCCGSTDSAEVALEMITVLAPRIVLLDLQLRDGDGLELLGRLERRVPKPRVIVISHKDQMVFAERALKAGAMGYVLKDEASDTLMAAIQTVLRGGVHLSPEMNRRLFKRTDGSVDAPVNRLRALYNRELQVLEYLGQGKTVKEIAHVLGISLKTADSYRESLKKKLGVPDSVMLVRLATLWQEHGQWDLPADRAT